MSARKVRLVAQLLKNLPAEEALVNLEFVTKKAVLPIKKLVNSGVANASHNFQIEIGRLFIKSLTVDGGQVMKRFKPRAQGRAFPIRRRTANINLTLGVKDKPFSSKRKIVVSKPGEGEQVSKTVEKDEPRSRSGFFRRKKKPDDNSQLPPKQEAQGKNYTSFNRRGTATGE